MVDSIEAHRQKRREQRLQTCAHFNGMRDDKACCRAGVNYRQHAGGDDRGWCGRMPCMPPPPNAKLDSIVPCDKRRLYTAEEVDAREEEIAASVKTLGEAMTRIRAAAGDKRGVRGTVECPKCGGQLAYSIASNNGHIWGACATEGCMRWMQ